MHASTVAILAIAAAAAPAFAQPIYARQDASGAFKISAGDIKDGIDIGNGLINAAGQLKQVITGHSRRELGELLTRALEEELMARQVDIDASGASIFSVAKDAFEVGKDVYDAFKGSSNSNNNNKRQDESGAFKISAGDIKDGIDIGNGLINAAGQLKQVITGHSRREVGELLTRALEEELVARQDDTDASGASIFSVAKDAFEVGKDVYDAFKGSSNSNNNNNKRQDESGAFKISAGDIKDGIDIGNGLINAAGQLKQVITGHSRREIEELLTRAYDEELVTRQDESGAFKISTGDIKDGVDIVNGVVNAAEGLKHVITGHSRRADTMTIPRITPPAPASSGGAVQPPRSRPNRLHRLHRSHVHPAAHAHPIVGPVSTLKPTFQRPQAPQPQAAAHKRFFSLNELD
ncbi:hypothetical protein EUX98_g8289 [Antrodiella citrinella]|uniref:Uncharacterized protein n=1 Tax=Antrodiella citrinella TaxID=2447956 RepID=A0A4S4MAP1_9APHY|nr:hypothetical protein EUX98_g8289 [Antrodiella citrinella]